MNLFVAHLIAKMSGMRFLF